MLYTKKEIDWMKNLKTNLYSALQESHGRVSDFPHPHQGHIPFHQHKRLEGIIHAIRHKFQEEIDAQMIDDIRTQFGDIQEFAYPDSFDSHDERHDIKLRRYQRMCGEINVAFIMHLKRRGYDTGR